MATSSWPRWSLERALLPRGGKHVPASRHSQIVTDTFQTTPLPSIIQRFQKPKHQPWRTVKHSNPFFSFFIIIIILYDVIKKLNITSTSNVSDKFKTIKVKYLFPEFLGWLIIRKFFHKISLKLVILLDLA